MEIQKAMKNPLSETLLVECLDKIRWTRKL